MVRGGNYAYLERYCRSAARDRFQPITKRGGIGFRVVIVGDLKPKPASPAAPVLDAAQAKQLQELSARTLGAAVEIENSAGMKFRFVPAGQFLMGSPDTEPDRRAEREGPRHLVAIARPYYLGAHEVTQEQYQKVTGQNPAHFSAENKGGPSYPVETVNHEDATTFCRLLSELPAERAAGRRYRLPTEAEWEYACRAGSATPFAHGDDPRVLGDYAWYRVNCKNPQPVGGLKPNAWGLFDMHGNVFELCGDRHDYLTGRSGPVGSGPINPRGGSWLKPASDARSAYRGANEPKARNKDVGFRVVCEIAAKPAMPPGAVVPFDTKAAEAHQEAWAKHLNTKVEFADKKLGMEFRVIPPGDFLMGAKDTEIKDDITKAHQNMPPGWQLLVRSLQAETPRHPVRITHPFAIGKYEVTVGQFKKFIEATGHKTDIEPAGGYGVKDGAVVGGKDYNWKNVGYPQADNAPVWNISRDDAVAFCKWLSKETGQTFRLPTEAEWEWACRAGTATRTFWDAEKLSDSLPYAWGSNKTGRKPQPVGGLKPNAFGLHDTCGNVWEWCSDWFSETYYTESAKNPLLSDPTGPSGPDGAGKTRHRVQRGGGVQGGHFGMSSTARSVHNQEVVGFRVVCEIAGDVKLPPPEPKKPEPPEVAPEPHAPAPR